jgi:hypothetical protein
MRLDAGRVLKRAVFCPHCNEDTLFSLRAIADDAQLRCLYCRNNIDIRDHTYELLVRDVRHTLAAIDSAASPFLSTPINRRSSNPSI